MIVEITRYYQALEVKSKFQELYLTETMKRDVHRYYRARKRIIKVDSNNKDFLSFMKIIEMNSLMHWCAYKQGGNVRDITIPMYQKLRDLFIRIKGINSILPTDKFDTLNIILKNQKKV